MNVKGRTFNGCKRSEHQFQRKESNALFQKQISELKEQHRKELERKDEQITLLQGTLLFDDL